MGKYTLRGSADLDARIDADCARVGAALAGAPDAALYRALVLIGGYGRGEGTPYIAGGEQRPFNDYDFVVVTTAMDRAARARAWAGLRALERSLTAEVGLPVDLCPYPVNTLPSAEFSLLNYEMKYGHRVVWGDPRALDALPAYPHDRIPRREGARLLMNRGKLLLDVRRALRAGAPGADGDRLRGWKFLMKAWLAFGDCTLLIRGAYDLRYAVKKERILEASPVAPPDMETVAAGYRDAIALKEWGDYGPLAARDLAAEFERVRPLFVRFLRWYEAQRLGADCATPAAHLAALARADRECPGPKAQWLNLAALRGGAFAGGLAAFLCHPRARLYAALPALLGDGGPDAETARVLGVPGAGREAVEDAFYRLQRRFS